MKHFFLASIFVGLGLAAIILSWSCQSTPSSSPTFPDALATLAISSQGYTPTFTSTPCGYPGNTCTPTPTPPPLCQATPIFFNTPVIGNTGFGTNNYTGSCGGTGNDIVFQFTLAASQTVTISTCSSNTKFDTVLEVLSSCNPVTQIGCNDQDASCPFSGNYSTISGPLPAGTYYIVADGWFGASGQFELSLR